MNPLTNVKNITKLNEIELAKGYKKSWHDMYKDSAWIFIGGLPYGLTEGDVLAVFSQYGEIVNINMVRDKKTGKTKGYCFLCYANQKSTILAVDNLNAIKLCSRTIRVDHVANYKPPKENEGDDDITKLLKSEGCAPKIVQASEKEEDSKLEKKKKKKLKKEKKEHKKKKKKHHSKETAEVEVKKEKHDPGYDKNDISKTSRTLENSSRGRSFEEKSSRLQNDHRSDTEKYSRHKFRDEEKDRPECYSNSKDRLGKEGTQEFVNFKNCDQDTYKKMAQNKQYFSSSEDDNSSSSSSDEEKSKYDQNKTRSRHDLRDKSSSDERSKHKKAKYEEYKISGGKQSSQTKFRSKYDDKKDSDYKYSKSKHYDKRVHYSEHRTQDRY